MNNDGQYYSEIISVRMIVEFYYDSSFNYFSFFFSTYWSDELVYFSMFICCFALAVYLACNAAFNSVALTFLLFVPNTHLQFKIV